MSLSRIHTEGEWFVDEEGRRVLLRGVNLGGDCKVPYPDGGTQHRDSLRHEGVSFIGRPFPLDEADEHLGRLAHWGFNCLRLLCTWEAIEHAGPGQLDTDFLDYYAEICRLAGEHGLYVFVDLHQDTWSRWTGGDGAPHWTLEAAGIDPERIDATGAATVMQHRYDYDDPRTDQPDRYPRMCWSRNYLQPANGILWTLFWAGRQVAPDWQVDGQNIQDFLQGHYLGAMRAVAERVAHQPHVLGFDTLNEPFCGWVGVAMSDRRDTDGEGWKAIPGLAFSPLDSLFIAAGNPRDVPRLAVNVLRGRCTPVAQETINPDGLRLWKDRDPFEHTWRVVDGQPEAVAEGWFQQGGDFYDNNFLPFVHTVARTVREVRDDWLVFFEKDAVETVFDPTLRGPVPEGVVNGSHWYDIVTLERKRFLYPVSLDVIHMRPAIGSGGIRRMYLRQLSRIRDASRKLHIPTLLGEFGIPYDLGGGAAYRAWERGDRSARPWRSHVLALSLMYDALDELFMSSTQWNYTASNRNDARIGDGWNQEDLSVFSCDQQSGPGDPDDGGRALDGFVRPYVRRVQGVPIEMRYRDGVFRFEWEAEPEVDGPTEVFVPKRCFPDGMRVTVDGARVDEHGQVLEVRAERQGRMVLILERP